MFMLPRLPRLLATLAFVALAFSLVAQAQPAKTVRRDTPKVGFKGDAKTLIEDIATRQAQLKRAFEDVSKQLVNLKGRLENGTTKEQDTAKAIGKALDKAKDQANIAKFDATIRELRKPGSERDIDAIDKALKETGELAENVRVLLELLKQSESALNKELMEKRARLLEQLKELIAKQERVRTQTEIGRKSNKELGKDQNKVTKETKDLVDGKKNDGKNNKNKGEAKAEGKPGEGKPGEGKEDTKTKSEGKPGENKDGEGKTGDPKGTDGKEGKPGEGKDNKSGEGKDGKGKEGKAGEGKPGEGKEGKAGESKDGKGKDGEGKPGEGKPGDSKDGKPGEGKPGEGKPGDGKEGDGKGKEGKPGDGKPGEGKPGDGKEGKGGEGKEGKGGDGKEGKPGEGKPGDGKEGKPGEGKPGSGKEGKPGEGKPGQGKEGKPGEGKPGVPGEGKPGAGKPSESKEAKPGSGKPGEGKPGEGKPGEGKPGEGKPGKGKPGKGEGKPGQGKPGQGKQGEGKPGQGKPGEGKPGQGKPGDSKGKGEGKGEAKPGKPSDGKSGGAGKPSESKSGGQGKSGQGKPGQGKGSKGSQGGQQQQPPDDNPVKKQIEDANKYQKQAETDLDKNKKDDATDKQAKAIKALEDAKKKLEDLLKQMREEEIERLLADLEKRCRYMLALQIEVRDSTVGLDKDIKKNDDPKTPTTGQAARGNKLRDKEEEILREADGALKIIQTEGSAVAFAEVFAQVKKDMEVVVARLGKTDTGKVTVQVENDIIETLKEMIDALKKAQRDAKNPPKQGKPGQKGMPQDQKLIDMLAELKMIYAMQRRVNSRTELYGKQYKGEQAPPPDKAKSTKERDHYEMIQKELKDLSNRQEKIGKVTKDIATGKNEAK